VENDYFDPEEAVKDAIDKWKFLIRRLLNGYDFVGENNSDDLTQLIGLMSGTVLAFKNMTVLRHVM
jgi:hypothetical protein